MVVYDRIKNKIAVDPEFTTLVDKILIFRGSKLGLLHQYLFFIFFFFEDISEFSTLIL